MKTILIESVSNGWIVRPFQACSDWACTDRPVIAVYTDMAEMTQALPSLLGVPLMSPPEPEDFPAAPKLDSDCIF